MKDKIVFMYSGQGSQYKNMGRELYESEPVFQYWMNRLDEQFKRYTGSSFFEEFYGCREKKESTQLIHTHLAIFIVEFSLTQVLLSQGIEPDSIIGVSLGEFTACAVNEIISLKDCMDLIVEQAKIITNICKKGTMLSVLGDLAWYKKSKELKLETELVSENFKNNYTISLIKDKKELVTSLLKKHHITYLSLPVEYGFHSTCIDDAKSSYLAYLCQKSWNGSMEMKYPQYSSAFANQLNTISTSYFWEIVRRPMDFKTTIQDIVSEDCNNVLVDLGPSGTLATSCKYILKQENVNPVTILTPYGQTQKNLVSFYRNID